MKLVQLGANQTQVHMGSDRVVLFSYETPVAALIDGQYYKVSKATCTRWSKTTSGHIQAWLGSEKDRATVKDQAWFDALGAF